MISITKLLRRATEVQNPLWHPDRRERLWGPRRITCPTRSAGDLLLVGPDNKIRVRSDDKLRVCGASDPCCSSTFNCDTTAIKARYSCSFECIGTDTCCATSPTQSGKYVGNQIVSDFGDLADIPAGGGSTRIDNVRLRTPVTSGIGYTDAECTEEAYTDRDSWYASAVASLSCNELGPGVHQLIVQLRSYLAPSPITPPPGYSYTYVGPLTLPWSYTFTTIYLDSYCSDGTTLLQRRRGSVFFELYL